MQQEFRRTAIAKAARLVPANLIIVFLLIGIPR